MAKNSSAQTCQTEPTPETPQQKHYFGELVSLAELPLPAALTPTEGNS
jgi:hypothetical protein